jgi:hypothetical protein
MSNDETPPLADVPLWERLPGRGVFPEEIAAALPRSVPGNYMAVSAPRDEVEKRDRITRMLIETDRSRFHALALGASSWVRADTVGPDPLFGGGAPEAVEEVTIPENELQLSGFGFIPVPVVRAGPVQRADGYTEREIHRGGPNHEHADLEPMSAMDFLDERHELKTELVERESHSFAPLTDLSTELSTKLNKVASSLVEDLNIEWDPVLTSIEVEDQLGASPPVATAEVVVPAAGFVPVGHPSPSVSVVAAVIHEREAEVTYEGPLEGVVEAMAADHGGDLEFGSLTDTPLYEAYARALEEKRGEAVRKVHEYLDSGREGVGAAGPPGPAEVGPLGAGTREIETVSEAAPDPTTVSSETVDLHSREAVEAVAEQIRDAVHEEVPEIEDPASVDGYLDTDPSQS